MSHSRPLAVDLFCGLGGWSEGLLAEGWDVVGIDIEAHVYGEHRYPGGLIIQDVRTLSGSAFSVADLIVASPPCQFFSYCAMPWGRAKALAAEVRADPARLAKELQLFNECFRIQREAGAAKGEHIPLIVENVRGAQPWVGQARWSFGSFFLWGDVPALMPPIVKAVKVGGLDWSKHGQPGYRGESFNTHAERRLLAQEGVKNSGGSWFAVAHNTTSGKGQNPDGRKLPGFRFDGSGRSFQSASVEGVKAVSDGGIEYGGSFGWDGPPLRRGNSKSPARKFASAMIAKIPLALSRHIGATFHPYRRSEAA